MFTRERLLELLPVMAHWANGGQIQITLKEGEDWENYPDNENPDWVSSCDYRIKPEPEFVSLEAKDIKPGLIFKRNEWGAEVWTKCIDCGYEFLRFGDGSKVYFRELLTTWKYSPDNGTTWLPCRKEKV